MCEQKTVLETLKAMPKKGGLSKATIMLAEAQAKDFVKMEQRMGNVEERLESVEEKLDTVDDKLNDVLVILNNQASPWKAIKELLSNKLVIIGLFVLISVLCGVPLSEVVNNYIKL